MNSERPREEDVESASQKNIERDVQRKQAEAPPESEIIRKTMKEKGRMGDQDHEEVEPKGLSSDGRL